MARARAAHREFPASLLSKPKKRDRTDRSDLIAKYRPPSEGGEERTIKETGTESVVVV
jgi:hypothetical protein